MIERLNASRPTPGRLIYVAYPLLTAIVTVAANTVSREMIMLPGSEDVPFQFAFVSLTGLLLVPAFLIHAAARLRRSRQTPRLFALGTKGIAAIAVLQLALVLVLSDMAKIMIIHLVLGGFTEAA